MIVLIALIISVPFLLFYNLDVNPRSWHDEGDALSLARTLAEDGFYGVRVSDGYQTFGMVQSVGPAVILPAALAFKLFGVSLVTGRAVAVVLGLLALIVFYLTGRTLIGRRGALVGILLLLSLPELRYFYMARQFLGLVPALGFFLAGFLLWYRAVKSRKIGLAVLAGIMLGCSILTKSQYLVLGLGAFGAIAILDLLYYRMGAFKMTLLTITAALLCYGAWNLFLWSYYGAQTFAENGDKLARLAQVAYGFRKIHVVAGIQAILGVDTGHYFMFWGFLAIAYTGFLGLKKDLQSMGMTLLLIFTCLSLAFVILWTFPWIWHFFAPLAVTVLLISKLFDDLLESILRSRPQLKAGIVDLIKPRSPQPAGTMAVIGALVAVTTFSLWAGINFKDRLVYDVLDRAGEDPSQWPRSFSEPYQAAEYLNAMTAPGSVIETSERELAVLTDLNYHTPDQSILIDVIPFAYNKTGSNEYQLGSEYFNSAKSTYLVVGYFARDHQVYDPDFIFKNFRQISVIGSGSFQYEVYQRITPFPD